jgi:pyrophosphatase PpaX
MKTRSAYQSASLDTIAALVFDIDGTLVDSASAVIDQFATLCKEFGGRTYSKKEIMHIVHKGGGSIHEIFRLMFGDLDEDALNKILERRAELIPMTAKVTKPFEGVVDAMDALKRRGYKIALFSTRESWIIKEDPSIQLLMPHVDVVISLEDIERPKPHPDGIIAALRVLDIDPVQALMVGDTTADVMSAKAAGVTSVAVTHGFGGRGSLAAARPDYLLDSVPELVDILAEKPARVVAKSAAVVE